ncbi:MAG TPA: phasin family protein [Stellaceae bacterium]|nr:phasin family protein [Stellaceae bacterium]
MAQAERRRGQQEMTEPSTDPAETTKKVVSAMATGGDAWMEGHAGLIEQIDRISQRWMQSQREAVEATRQSIAEMQRARDLSDVMRVQQEWLAGAWQRFTIDVQALTSLALHYQRRTMNWAGEAAEVAGEQVRRTEHAMLNAAGAKPGGEARRE